MKSKYSILTPSLNRHDIPSDIIDFYDAVNYMGAFFYLNDRMVSNKQLSAYLIDNQKCQSVLTLLFY